MYKYTLQYTQTYANIDKQLIYPLNSNISQIPTIAELLKKYIVPCSLR